MDAEVRQEETNLEFVGSLGDNRTYRLPDQNPRRLNVSVLIQLRATRGAMRFASSAPKAQTCLELAPLQGSETGLSFVRRTPKQAVQRRPALLLEEPKPTSPPEFS